MVVNSLGACGALWTSRKVCSIRLQGSSPRYVRCSRDRHLLNRRGNRSIESSGKELSGIHTAFTMRVRSPTGLNSSALRKAITWLLDSRTTFSYSIGSTQAFTNFETRQHAYSDLGRRWSPCLWSKSDRGLEDQPHDFNRKTKNCAGRLNRDNRIVFLAISYSSGHDVGVESNAV